MSAHLHGTTSALPPVAHLRSTLALAEATRMADRALMGRHVKPSLLRDMLVRLILVEFGEGRIRSISHYQAALAPYGGRSSVRREILSLSDAGAVRLDVTKQHHHPCEVTPTDRLLTWAAEHIPRLAPLGRTS